MDLHNVKKKCGKYVILSLKSKSTQICHTPFKFGLFYYLYLLMSFLFPWKQVIINVKANQSKFCFIWTKTEHLGLICHL